MQEKCLLEPYRVLDLTEGGYLLAGRMLADLGADVIKVEPPGGSLSRSIGPFFHDEPDMEKSLFWFAYNNNKRSITLNLETFDGRELFKRLAKTADFILESCEPGYLGNLGLGYQELSNLNPGIIVTSITPFGSSGPYAHFKSSELITWALGGFLGITGVDGRPPVWVGFPQASLHAGSYAAAASMIAHWHRVNTGEGQHVTAMAQPAVIMALYSIPRWWEFLKLESVPRKGARVRFPNADPGTSLVYSCKDGEVLLIMQGGASVIHHSSSIQMVKYMAENGMASEWLSKFDWIMDFDASTIKQNTIERIEAEVCLFLMTKTKLELFEAAQERRILLAPFADAKDVYENPQLKARNFWVEVQHPELGKKVDYCGPFVQLSSSQIKIRRRPPLIGEHNVEVYGELGITRQEIIILKQAEVI